MSLEPNNSTIFPQARTYITVKGDMNPTIHHPLWYEKKDILTSGEVEAVIKEEGIRTFPGFLQFSVAGTDMFCDYEEYSLGYDSLKYFGGDRPGEQVVRQIFDVHLPETPISEYIFKFEYVIEIDKDRWETQTKRINALCSADIAGVHSSGYRIMKDYGQGVQIIQVELPRVSSAGKFKCQCGTSYKFKVPPGKPLGDDFIDRFSAGLAEHRLFFDTLQKTLGMGKGQ